MTTIRERHTATERCRLLRSRSSLAFALFLVCALTPPSMTAQRHGRAFSVPARHKSPALTVEGKITSPLYLYPADFRLLPRTTVSIVQSTGESWNYEGVSLIDVLRRAGVPLGPEKRKRELLTYVEAVSRDGSHVIFSVSEVDPAFNESHFLIADTLNGSALGKGVLKLSLIAGGDKPPGRSVDNLVSLRVRRVR